MLIEERFHPRRTLEIVGKGTVFMGIPTFYYAFLDRPEFPEAAGAGGTFVSSPAARHRSGRRSCRAGDDPRAAGDQSLRHDRGARYHQPAARWALAPRIGGFTAAGNRAARRQGRRHCCIARRGRIRPASRPEPVS